MQTRILELLRARRAHATFYLLESRAEGQSAITSRLQALSPLASM
jgi:peptidoglycan/xylan/chitin deacetylase (PgdA/CDA1 family)